MIDWFGADLSFRIADNLSTVNTIANIGAVRDGADTEGALTFRAGTNGLEEFMRISSAGNVGIGTSTPGQKLTVSGNALITGAIYDSTVQVPTAWCADYWFRNTMGGDIEPRYWWFNCP